MTPTPVSMRERLRTDYAWTVRQKQVLELMAQGRSNTEIAEELGLSLAGAKWHVSEILSKLQADQREEAAEYWRRYNGIAPRFERVFRGLAGGLATKWVAGAAGVLLVTGAATAAIVAVAIHTSSDELDEDSPIAPQAEPTPDTVAPPVDASPRDSATFQWRWDSAVDRNSWIWVRADPQNIVASYGTRQVDFPPALGGGVAMLDQSTGAEIWRLATGGHAFPAALTADHVVVGTAEGRVFGLERNSGRVAWRRDDFPGIPFQAVAARSVVVIADADPAAWGADGLVDGNRLGGHVWGLDPTTGNVKWRVQVGAASAYVTYGDGVVVVASSSTSTTGSESVALDAVSGRELWRAEIESATSPPVVVDGRAIVAGGKLTAFDLQSGDLVWAVEPQKGGAFGTFAFPAGQGDLVAAGTDTGTFEVLSVSGGTVQSIAAIGNTVPRAFSFGGELYALMDGGLMRFEPSGGAFDLAPFFIGQGDWDVVAVAGDLLVVTGGTGHLGTSPQVIAIKSVP